MSSTNSLSTFETPKVKFSLNSKLFLLVLISFGFLMVFIIYQVGLEAEKVADTTIRHSLNQSKRILETRLNSRFEGIVEKASNLVRDGNIQAWVFEEKKATLQDQCSEYEQSLDFDLLAFTNDLGEILAISDKRHDPFLLSNHSLLEEVLDNNEVSKDLMITQGETGSKVLVQIVGVPIREIVAEDIVRGAFFMAYELSQELAEEIQKLAQSQIALYYFSPVSAKNILGDPLEVLNTFDKNKDFLKEFFEDETEIRNLVLKEKKEMEAEIMLGKEIFHSLIYPLKSGNGEVIGFFIALRSRTELMKPFVKIKNRTFAAGIGCLIFASFVAFAISRHITRPIADLVSVTKQIQDGKYPELEPSLRNDEVGILSHAIHRMGQGLKQKAELEDYLAGISEAISDFDNQTKTKLTEDMSSTILDREINNQIRSKLMPKTIIEERYRIEHIIGSGAVGVVYLANDLQLNEPVALKFLMNPLLTGEALEHFKQEIRLARKITHRNILRTFDFGRFEELHYISMEYISGYDIGKLIKSKGPIDLKIGVLLARQMCSAIGAAHTEGVIHRDLKPQNMMITNQGILKVMDFGLAINFTKIESDAKEINSSKKRETEMVGTPNFMSPEQYSRTELDPRSDIYSLGVILFYVFAGELPFKAKSLWELSQMHLNEPPPLLRSIRPDAPKHLEDLINIALAKKPSDRFSRISELGEELALIQL